MWLRIYIGHFLFIFAVFVPKDSDCDHKIRIPFYDKIEVLEVVFITPQHRLRSFCNLFMRKERDWQSEI